MKDFNNIISNKAEVLLELYQIPSTLSAIVIPCLGTKPDVISDLNI